MYTMSTIRERRIIAKKNLFASSSLLFAIALALLSSSASAFLASFHHHCRVPTESLQVCPPSSSWIEYKNKSFQHQSLTEIAMAKDDATTATTAAEAMSPSIVFRPAACEDIPRCFEIESASYPSDEAATMESLVNRQKYAGDYFLLCTETGQSDSNSESDTILGFVCATRCQEFTEESMSELHDPSGPLLAIHSVVIDEAYRRKGLATRLLNQYVQTVLEQEESLLEESSSEKATPQPIESIVLISKQHLLGFYVRCGFSVNRPSPIVHGKELWYDLEMKLEVPNPKPAIRTHLLPGESWFCKTETFKTSLTFPEIKPHLDAHTQWVQDLREAGETCIVSGYRVDSHDRPGGGGLLFVAATSYEEAYELVSQNDPLIVNGCVDWELNGWKSQVGGIRVD